MKRKLVVFLCALSLMGWIHAQEAAPDPVAAVTVGEKITNYTSLKDAIDAANEEGDSQAVTITLLKDVTCTTDVALGVGAANPITLDLAGRTLNCGPAQLYTKTKSTGLVTLTGNGTVKNDNAKEHADYAAIRVFPDSALKLDGVTVEGNYCAVKNSGTLTVEAATIKATTYGIGNFGNGKATIGTESGDNTKISVTSGCQAIATAAATCTKEASVVIYSGSFTTSGTQWYEDPIYWAGHGTLEVYGGTFTNTGINTEAAGLLQKNGTVAVYGGTFSARDGIKLVAQSDSTELTTTIQGGTFTGRRSGLYIDASDAANMGRLTAYEVTIANGESETPTFKGGDKGALYTKTDGLGSRTLMTLTGGRYTTDPSTYCAEGYCCATNKLKIEQTVFYAVRKQSAVFEVCSAFSNGYQAAYENLTEALTAAQAFSTKLVNVVGAGTVSEDVVIPADTYLDIYASGASLTVPADKTLTVSANCKRLGVRTGTLTIEAGGKVLIAGGSSSAGLVAVWKNNSNASVTGEFSLPEGHILCCTENLTMASYWSAPEADKVAEARLADGRVANLTASAMSSLPTGWTQLKLFQNVSCNTIISTNNAVIDLNKKTWTGTSTSVGVFTINATGVTVKNGTVKAGDLQPYAINLQSGSLTLESNAKIMGGSSCALYCQGDTSLTTAGTITNTNAPAISGNGNQNGTMITVTGGTITSTNSTAIYHPQRGTLEIQKGTITGYNGIQMCAGELKVTGKSTITATGTDIATSKTGTDGPINDGAAISVVNRSYPGSTPTVSVTASLATITSERAKAVYAYTWQDSASTKVCEPWPEATQYIALFDGYYSEDVSGYCVEGYHAYYVSTTPDTPKWKVLVADTFEASVTHEEVVTQYATLSAANCASQEGDTLTLNRALESVGSLSVTVTKKNLTWDLNGITLKSPLNVQASGLKIKNGTMAPRSIFNPPATLKTTKGTQTTGTQVNVTLEDVKVCQNYTASSTISLEVPGTLTLSGNTQVQAGSGTGIGCSATGVGVTVASSASITGALGVSVWGTKQSDGSYDAQGVKVQVDGTITATDIGLNVFGSIKATEEAVPEIALGSKALVTSGGVGIYAAGYAKWTIANGAQISGALTGIEIRAGELTVNGGTIKSLAKSYSVEPNVSGTTTVGAGIAVAQHTTELPLTVTITGGTISGPVALSEANPQGNAAIEQVSLNIQGGTFVAQSAAVVSADCKRFISGGYFSNAVPLAYCATGKVPKTLTAVDNGYMAAAPYTVEPVSGSFVAVKADGSAEVYKDLADVKDGTKVYIAPSAEEGLSKALSAKATTGPAKDPTVTTLTVKEAAEVLGGAFTVSEVTNQETQTTERKLVYHYNFGVAGLEVRKQAGELGLTVVAKLTEGELPANRTLVGRTLQVVLTKGDGSEATYDVANPVFDAEGQCRVPVPWSAMKTGTNSIKVKVVK